MPRLTSRRSCLLSPRAGSAAPAALALLLLALPPGLAHAALASAAGSVFEATPFVLGAALLPGRLARFAPLLACGCGGRLPSALSLPAVALCWLAFGPAVTLARAAAALGLAVATLGRYRRISVDNPGCTVSSGGSVSNGRNPHRVDRRQSPRAGPSSEDPIGDLVLIGLATFTGAFVAGSLPPITKQLWTPAAFLAGAAAGALLPCATAGLVAASSLRTSSPAATAGLLAASGIIGLRRGSPRRGTGQRATLTLAFTALACLLLTAGGGHGFLNPRLLAVGPAGALTAALALGRGVKTSLRHAALLPLCLLAALASGSPLPEQAAAVLPLGLYPGLAVDFTGTVLPGGREVGRAAILCCRADARMLRLPLDRALGQRPGSWVRVRGRIESSPAGLRLAGTYAAPVRPPADPFTYL